MRRKRTDDDASVIAASVADPERFAIIYDRHAAAIHRYLARRLGVQVADDLVGETFWPRSADASAMTADGSRRCPGCTGSPRTSSPSIAARRPGRTACCRSRRRSAPMPGHDERVSTDVTATAQRDRLVAALADLTPGDRDVLLLIAQEELRYEQVAAALDIPVGTVRSRLHRARVTLRAALGGTNPMNVEEEVISRG